METLSLNLLGLGEKSTQSLSHRSNKSNQSGRNTHRSIKSSRSTARSKRSNKSSKRSNIDSDSDPDFINDSDSSDSDTEPEWIEAVDSQTTLEDAMYQLWKHDPETFYLEGKQVMEMLTFKFKHNWSREEK